MFLLAPISDQPLYDGVGLPDDPYRHIVPPAGLTETAAPLGATAAVRLVAGSNPAPVTLLTGEQGPQALVALRPGAVRGSGNQAAVRVEPGPPPPRQPGGVPLGNAYAVTADPPARLVGAPLVQLRVPFDIGPPVALLHTPVDARPGRAWAALPTRRTGHDTWTAELPPGPGRVVAVRVTDPSLIRTAQDSDGRTALTWAVALLAVLVGAVVVLRRTRSGQGAGGSGRPSKSTA